MSRLISEDELKTKLVPLSFSTMKWVSEVDIGLCATIDAEPVRHGHWVAKSVMVRQPYAFNHICSVCGEETNHCGNYCSRCGAMMDEKSEE